MKAGNRFLLTALGVALVVAGSGYCGWRGKLRDLHGVVRTADGVPVAGATVTAVKRLSFGMGEVVESGADGSFAFRVENGEYALSATSARGTAVYRAPEVPGGAASLTLAPAEEGFEIAGHVGGSASPTPGEGVYARRPGNGPDGRFEAEVFVTRVDAHGDYRVRLPKAEARAWTLEARAGEVHGSPATIDEARDRTVDLDLTFPVPPSAAVVEEVARASTPLATVEAGHGFEDLEPFGRMVGEAHLVGLGEGTHGTREFFQLKHRLFEYLVEEKGFRAIAFEASRAEARRVNHYVLGGPGAAADALEVLDYWTWQTEEVRALLDWMRAYNADPAHATGKVQFLGFDMEFTRLAANGLSAYLTEVDRPFLEMRRSSLAFFAQEHVKAEWLKLDAGLRAAMRTEAEATVARFDSQREAWVRAMGLERWLDEREDARGIAQWTAVHAGDKQQNDFDFATRDVAMTENVDEALARSPGIKIALWAHNGHVAVDPSDMGGLLRKEHGADYAAVGMLFGEGEFQAYGDDGVKKPFALGPAPETDGTTPLARAGKPLLGLDLRALPAGPARAWFDAPHLVRLIGVRFRGIESSDREALGKRFDEVFFVARTTAARALPER